MDLPAESLDFIYMPSRDVATDLAFYTDKLGAEVVWAIEAFGTRVARVRLAGESPAVLLAEHLEGDRPILLHRVESLDEAVGQLEMKGVELGGRFGFPHGSAVEFEAPGGQRLAVYELERPGADEKLGGRRDF